MKTDVELTKAVADRIRTDLETGEYTYEKIADHVVNMVVCKCLCELKEEYLDDPETEVDEAHQQAISYAIVAVSNVK